MVSKSVFIVQNIELGSTNALSINLTNILNQISKNQSLEINAIFAKSKTIDSRINNNLHNIFQIDGCYSSAKDNFSFSLKVFSTLRSNNKTKKVDVIHCLYPNSSLLPAVFFKLFVNTNVRIIYDTRSPWIDMIFARDHIRTILNRFIWFFLKLEERFLVQFVDHYVFISDGLRKHYKKDYKIKKIPFTIIPSGVDVSHFSYRDSNLRYDMGLTRNDIVIGYVGAIAAVRKLDVFIDHFEHILEEDERVKLVFIGDGNFSDKLKNIVAEKGLNNSVLFMGEIPPNDLPEYYSIFDFGLSHLPDIPVYKHCFPLKILEYLSCGIPVLVSDIQAHRDISNQLDGVYIYKNSSDLVEIVRTKNKKINQDMSLFSWSHLAEEYQKIYQSL